MFVQVVDEGIGTGWIAQGYQVLEEGNLQLALADQGIAVPAIVGLFVEEQDLQFPLGPRAFLKGDRQGDVRGAEADTDKVVNDGGCCSLGHFQCPLDRLPKPGSDRSRAARKGVC